MHDMNSNCVFPAQVENTILYANLNHCTTILFGLTVG